jgi:predicted small integral membrane protein
MIEVRLSKIAIVASLALFSALCAVDNLIDHDTNFAFVSHVLSMDTTFQNNALMGRAITSPTIWNAAYVLIILFEAVVGITMALAAVQMAGSLHAPAARFDRAKRLFFLGATLGFLLWFTGFTVIAGEWFTMWQSEHWNGLEAAFRFYLTLMVAIVFMAQEEGELPN